jgi:aminoglycoside phosphotransferase (APT) family kinase protein
MSNQPELLPWRKEHDLDADGLRRVLEDQFPELAPVSLQLIGEGWDSEAYAVNDELIFRMPKRREVETFLMRERCLLGRFADRLPLPVPRFEWNGAPTEHYPFQFSGYRRLSGVPAIERPDLWRRLEQAAIAEQLGVFLTVLHAISAEDAQACGLMATRTSEWDEEALRERTAPHLKLLQGIDAALAQRLDRWLNETSPAPFPSDTQVPVHADLGAEHLLIDTESGRLSGVIDWGDICLGLAAGDMVGCVAWLGIDFLDQLLNHYTGPVTRGDMPWMIERGVLVALSNINYGERSARSDYFRLGMQMLDQLLP